MKSPYLNAFLAALYIVGIVFVIQWFTSAGADAPKETIFIPMTMLALLVLSVAVMGFLFSFHPIRLYLDGQKEEAVVFFAKTLGTFAVLAAISAGFLLYTLSG